jgi:hypothetical protein
MDYRARRELLWDATDGISKATKALERLSVDYKHKGAEEAWDDALVLWEAILGLTAKHTEARRDEDA